MSCFTSNKPIDFRADLDDNPEPGIFSGIFTTRYTGLGTRILRDKLS